MTNLVNFLILTGKQTILWTDLALSSAVFIGILVVVMFGFIDVPVGISALLEKAKSHLSKDAIQNESSTPHSYGGLIFGQFMLWLFIYSVYYCSGMCLILH